MAMPQTPFLDYLRQKGLLQGKQFDERRLPSGSSDSWLGRLMLNHNLIGIEHIDEILNRQDIFGGFFGENAIALGYVSADQLDVLLLAQQLRRDVELIENLSLRGLISFEQGIRELLEFQRLRGDNNGKSTENGKPRPDPAAAR